MLSNAALAGLGQIQVHSYLGEPFMATIPLTGDTAKDAIDPELSTSDQLAKINVMGSSAASDLSFTIVRRKGNSYIRVTSRAPVREPVLSFGVNVQSASGTISRQFSALLDIREAKGNQNTYSTDVSPKKETATGKTQTNYRSSVNTYTVQEGDTLYSIAAQFKPSGLSIAQTKQAIFLNNPKAFAKGNSERILTDVTLHIPSDRRMRSLVATAKPKVVKKPTTTRPITTAATTTPPVTNVDKSKVDAAKIKADADKVKTEAGETEQLAAENTTAGLVASQVEVSEPAVDASEVEQIEKELAKAEAERKRIEEEASAAAATLAESPPPVVPPPAQEPLPKETSIVGTLMKYAPYGLGGLAILLLGFLAVKKRSSKKAEERNFIDEDSFLDMTAMMGAGSTTKSKPAVSKSEAKITAAATQMVETINTPAPVTVDPERVPSTFMTDFTRMSAAIDTGEIDPLSEAEVYIAYGRNDEAEEILKDALTKDPAQHEIRKKLLEIYASKQELDNFETMARELYDAFDGRGAVWQEIAQMGLALDPNNSLYQQAGRVDDSYSDSKASEEITESLGFLPEAEIEADRARTTLSEAPVESTEDDDEATELAKAKEFDAMFEFSGDAEKSSVAETFTQDSEADSAIRPEDSGLEFDLDSVLSDAKDAGTLENISLSAVESIDFTSPDFTSNDHSNEQLAAPDANNGFTAEDGAHSFADDPLSTKLELAKVYIDMGDLDGAKEVLEELVEDADGALLHEAEQMLKKLSL